MDMMEPETLENVEQRYTTKKNTRLWRGPHSLVVPYREFEVPAWLIQQSSSVEPTDDPTNCNLVFSCIDGDIYEVRTLVGVQNAIRETIFRRRGEGLQRGRHRVMEYNRSNEDKEQFNPV